MNGSQEVTLDILKDDLKLSYNHMMGMLSFKLNQNHVYKNELPVPVRVNVSTYSVDKVNGSEDKECAGKYGVVTKIKNRRLKKPFSLPSNGSFKEVNEEYFDTFYKFLKSLDNKLAGFCDYAVYSASEMTEAETNLFKNNPVLVLDYGVRYEYMLIYIDVMEQPDYFSVPLTFKKLSPKRSSQTGVMALDISNNLVFNEIEYKKEKALIFGRNPEPYKLVLEGFKTSPEGMVEDFKYSYLIDNKFDVLKTYLAYSFVGGEPTLRDFSLEYITLEVIPTATGNKYTYKDENGYKGLNIYFARDF